MSEQIENARKDTASAENPVLVVEDLYMAYGQVLDLHGVSLEVRESELVSICGVNGAGKSTLLKSIAGVLKPQSGHIRFKGQEIGRAHV